MVLLLNTSFA